MHVEFTTSGDFEATISWLKRSKDRVPMSALNDMGKEGVGALKGSTPKGETGQTAAGWSYRVSRISVGAELAFVNNAHPETGVNIARLIQLGHGTGTGGYVQPIDYINPALKSVLGDAGTRLAKEMFK